MSAIPFSVFKRTDRPCFLVAFKDNNGNYLPALSTKKKTEDEAMAVAFQLLRDGVPQKKAAKQAQEMALAATAKNVKTTTDAINLLSELTKMGWIKNGVVKETPAAENLITYHGQLKYRSPI